jgi:Putative lumazine-binding
MNDEQQIRAVIQTYFDCMYESSAAKAHAAFHAAAKITGYLPDGLHQMSVGDFADFVASQQPSAREKGEAARLDVLSLDVAGNTAVARVRDDYLGMTFLDTLSFLKSDDQWRIYNKLFHVEGASH